MRLPFYKLFDSKATLKDADAKLGIVTGYFASFGNEDSDGDIIVQGAFKNTIALNGPDSAKPRIKHLLDHDTRQALGKLTVLKEDDKGLYYESQIGTHQLGQDFLKMCESGLITEHSIGYRIIKGNMDQDKGVYQLMELALYEGSSLQFWGANDETPLTGMKSEGDLLNNLLLCERELKRGTYSDEAFALIQKHVDDINAALKSRTTIPTPEVPEPEQTKEGQIDFAGLTDFYKSLHSTI